MRAAVIGLGSIGARHSRNLIALGCEAIGYDNAADRVLWYEESQGQASSLAEVVECQPDAVLICTPAATHATVARDLLACGFRGALFVEKPLALALDECEVFRSWPHPTTMVGYQCRFHEKARAMKVLFPEPSYAAFHCNVDMRTWPGRSYGPFLLEASHELDLALWFGAPASRMNAQIDDDSDMWIGFGKGNIWNVYLANHASRYFRYWFVRPDSDNLGAYVNFHSPDELGNEMYVDELAHFLACVRENTPTITPFADGLRVLEVCEAVEKMTRCQT